MAPTQAQLQPQPRLQTEPSSTLLPNFEKQRAAYLADPVPDYHQRKQDLLALKRMITENREEIIAAISEDFGNRSRHETLFADIISVTESIRDNIKHLRKWMKPQKRHVDHTMYPGGKNRVIPQPLGVVGVIVPWNFPVNSRRRMTSLRVSPLAPARLSRWTACASVIRAAIRYPRPGQVFHLAAECHKLRVL